MTVTPLDPAYRPGKIIALHLNYESRIAQRGRRPAFPSFFLKPQSSLALTGGTIERPAGTELLAFEGEIGLIIGAHVRHIDDPALGWAAVSAITAANDFGVYDLRYVDKGSNLRNKGGDGFTPIGPNSIDATNLDPSALRVRTWVNGVIKQDDTTEKLAFSLGTLIADLSQLMTLEPGDIILTGTPAGSSVVLPGDVVEVEVDAPTAPGAPTSGRLVTTVTEGVHPLPAFSAGPKVDDLQREEAWGSREEAGLPAAFELTDELKDKLRSVATATLSQLLRKRGYNNVSIDGLTATHPGAKVVGRARTLRYIANREDLFESHGGGYNAQKRLFDSLQRDDVVVIEARGETESGTLGDVLALRARHLGAAALITDGGIRDLAVVTEIGVPAYHSGGHPAVLGRRHVPWEFDNTVTCGGCAVQPGDVVVGDSDGILVIPPFLVEEVVNEAIAQEEQEEFIAEVVASGEPVKDVFPLNAAWKAKFEAWKAARS